MIPPNRNQTAARIRNIIEQFQPPLDAFETVYKSVHQHVELSLQLTATSSIAAKHLKTLGYYVREKVGGHGVVGVLKNGQGPTVLLRAELDALTVLRDAELLDACKERIRDTDCVTQPVMWACEHGMHLACLMGAATLLYDARSKWRGSLVLVFQPERERAGGAQAMIDDGLYTNGDVPLPDVVLGQHLVNIRAGYIATPADYSLPGKTMVAIKSHGRCGHDVEPHQRIDPAEIAGRIINGVESIVCQKNDMNEWTSLSCGDINLGDAPNTNRDEATLRIEIRAYSPDILIQAVESVKRIVQEKCDVYFCLQKPDFKQIEYTPPLINDPEIEEVVTHQFREFFGQMTEEMHENSASRGSTSSEDFAVIAPNGILYVYWGFGSNDHEWWERLQKYPDPKEHPTKHDANYAPVIQPTLKSGVDALAVAALTFLTQGNGREGSR